MSSSLMAPIDPETGKLQTHSTSGDSLSQKTKNKNEIDSDMFLSLLVAEMQNQDPLEPTSNTEWVSQYATFTQVSKMSEMAQSVDLLRANDLVGKSVLMKVTSESTGEVSYAQGIVDYVLVENGKPILVIDDNKYNISDLDTVMSNDYSDAYKMYNTFKGMVDALPDVKFADKSYENVVQGAYDYYNTMNDYQKNFMASYAAEQMTILGKWKEELEKLGVKINAAPEEEKTVTLNDIMDSFNTKMNAILEKLNALSGTSDNTEDEKSDTEDKNESDATA